MTTPPALTEVTVLPLHVSTVDLPEGHPEGAGPCEVFAFAVREPGGVVLVDSGVGSGSEGIDRAYAPRGPGLEAALAAYGIALGDVTAIVASHLHFDHCGSHRLLPGVPIWVQADELAAADADPFYTVAEWLHFEGERYRPVEGDQRLSEHVKLVRTPGHTPGHQSVLVEGAGPLGTRRLLVAAQATYDAAEWQAALEGGTDVAPGQADPDAYLRSRQALLALRPDRVFFSHDPTVWRSPAERYWQQLVASGPPAAPDYLEAFGFGMSPQDATEILEIVLAGEKTATGSLLWSYEADGKRVPAAGDLCVVHDGEETPTCIVETTDARVVPFDEVGEEYARWGGEGDRTLATWRPMYWRYIESECRRIGREPSRKTPLVMERFRVVYREPLR